MYKEVFIPHKFNELEKSDQAIGEECYNKYVDWFHDIEASFEKVVYGSDGLGVIAIVGSVKPRQNGMLYPVIIYNRGGSGDAGKITVKTLKERFYPFIKSGYIVIGSQYRGNDGGDGHDELGGDDVNDVINLYQVIKSLDFADLNNVFMVGFSRGGINTFSALQKNIVPIKAAAIINGVSDLYLFEQLRPDAIPLLEEFIPNYHSGKVEEFDKRSAIKWVQDIKVPMLLIHASGDKVIDVSSSQKLYFKLLEYDKICKLIIYPGSDHFLTLYLDIAIHEILNWFDLYRH